MARTFNRRNFLGGVAIAAGSVSLPLRVAAQPSPLDARGRQIMEIARREVERAGNVLWRRDIAGIADFSAHSSQPRFHFANLEQGTVRSFLVAHGTGSDPEHDGYLDNFSNVEGSNCTSRGAYVTWEWYKGRYGTSIRLGGLDGSNSNALPRAIVMHPATYATPEHVARWGRLGRSNGCFAMSPDNFREALWHLSGGRLLFADQLNLEGDGKIEPSPPITG
ncbi:twin-arginine translocation signal domain-containing protein [Altericroceibacterium spongiae]|uniref:Twin-arginine translocation signal domain-containing protein n=1 Tax=Altericroceibacterium spongiae TaxID=2320269 RepID=A0A420ELT6_9SPHN|nr:murein L,D-transpeptidase catalytic domain family protein [Altericroceibacterium spongiae]RKF21665.1 twin-arginine translocation signal domain-containing protein [Altericroceibacterium spongiae]